MKIKVKVDSNLRIKNVFEPPMEVELKDEENTLKDVLGKARGKIPVPEIYRKG